MKPLHYLFSIVALVTSLPVIAAQVANYHADGDATDATSTHNGTTASDVTFSTGRLGQGFSFPGTDNTTGKNVVTIPDGNDFKPANITVSAWVKFSALSSISNTGSASDVQFIVTKQNTRAFSVGYSFSYYLAKNAGNHFTFGADLAPGVEVAATGTSVIIPGRWYHVVGTYDHTSFKLYVNGKLEAQTAETRDLEHATTPLYLGRTNSSDFDFLFKGVLDEVQLFDTALTPAQIPALDPANAGTGLVSWWRGEGNGKDFQGSNDGGAFGAGKVGRAFQFDGVKSYARVTGSTGMNPSGSFTIDAWIFPTVDGTHAILSKWGDSGDYANQRAYIFGTDTNRRLFFSISDDAHQFDTSFQSFATSDNAITLNAWNHVAAVYDQSTGTRRIFVNGVEKASRTDTPITVKQSSEGIGIGTWLRSSTSVDYLFVGKLDEVDFFNRALSASEIQAIFTADAAGKNGASFGSSLVSWWRGEDNANDAQGNNNGTFVTPEAYDASGKVNQAFTFSSGAGNYVSIPDAPSLRVKTFTIDAWVNFSAIPSIAGHIFGKALGGSAANSYIVWYQNGALHGYMEGGPVLNYNWSPTFGQWYHVAYTYDGNTQTLYVDGSVVASGATTVTPSYDTHPALIGADYDFGTIKYQFEGKIDEVDLFDRALSGSEVSAIFTAGATGKSTAPSLSIVDTSCTLDSSGAGNMVFTVNVARPNASPITVNYETVDGSAVAPTDYSPVFNDTLTIPANTSSATITVPVNSSQATPGMTFFVTLSSPSNATINRAYGTGSILTGNAVNDFFTDSNTGTQLWQYGYNATDGTGFTAFNNTPRDANITVWNTPSVGDIGLVFNSSGGVYHYNIGTNQPADELGMFPNPDGKKCVVRWKAPAGGSYQVTGLFEGIESAGGATTSDVSIVKNGDTNNPLLFNSGDSSGFYYLNGYQVQKTFSMNVTVAAGDTLDFRVGWGNNNQYSYDGTGLKVSITPVAPVTITFSATGPASAGAPIQFEATTATGWNVRVQAATTASPVEGDWTDLNDGNGGKMTEISSGNYRLTSTSLPVGTQIRFRAIAAKPSQTDVISVPLGPFALKQAVLSIGAKITSTSDFTNGLTAYIDDYLIYKLTFTNSGGAPAKSLRITATVPDFQYADIPLLVKTTAGSTTVTLASGDTSQLQVGGTFASGPGLGGSVVGNPNGTTVYIPVTATITGITDATHFTISQAATTSSGTKTVSVLVQYGAMRKQFKASDISLSPGGTYVPETSPGAGNAKLVWNVGDLQGIVPVTAPFGYSNYVTFSVKLTGKVAVDQSIGIGNDYKVESASTPKQPVAGRTGFESGSPNVSCRINGSISFLLNSVSTSPQSGTATPGGYLTYTFALFNRGTAAAANPVAVVEVPNNVRFATSYANGMKGVFVTSGTQTSKLVYHTGNPLPQVVLKFSALAAKTTVLVQVTFQVKWVDPNEVTKISTINYGAAFLDPSNPKPISAASAFTTEFNIASVNPLAPTSTNFFTLISDPANKLARSLNQSGVVNVKVGGNLDAQPKIDVWKQISNTLAKSEEGSDGIRIDLVRPGDKITFMVIAQNTGASPADEVYVTDAMPDHCTYVAKSAAILIQGKTKNTITCTPDPDGRHLLFTGLHLEPNDRVFFTYTVLVDNTLVVPAPTAPPLLLTVGDFSIGSGCTTTTPVGFATARLIKVIGAARLAQPRLDVLVPRPVVSADVNATSTTLNTLYAKTPSARPITDSKNLISYIDGVERYYVHYENIGTSASANMQLTVPLPANTAFYRASWVTLTANSSPGGLPTPPGTLINPPAGGIITAPTKLATSGNVVFTLGNLAVGGKGDVMVEVIPLASAITGNSSHIGETSQIIQCSDSAGNLSVLNMRQVQVTDAALPSPPPAPRVAFAPPPPALVLVPSVGLQRLFSKQYVATGDTFTVTLTVFNFGEIGCHPIAVFTVPDHTVLVSADYGFEHYVPPAGEEGSGLVIQHVIGTNNVGIYYEGEPDYDPEPLKPHTAGAWVITLRATSAAGMDIPMALSKVAISYHDDVVAAPATLHIVAPLSLANLAQGGFAQVTGHSFSTLANGTVLVDIGGGQVVAAGAGNIVSAGAGNIIASGAGNLLTSDGAGVVAAGAGNLMAVAHPFTPSSLVPLSGLVANNSFAITNAKLGNHVVQNASAVVSAGAGNVVSAGAGNVVSAGAGNVVSQGGGNAISTNGSSAISNNGSSAVAQGAGNIVATGGGNIIAAGAGNIVSAGAGNIVSAGAGNVVAAGAGNIVSAGAGNVVSQGGGN